MICYSTSESTADLYFIDGGSGLYYSNDGTSHPGYIALEISKNSGATIETKTFAEVVIKTDDSLNLSTTEVTRLNQYSKPFLRLIDYGVISYFPDISKRDELLNNELSTASNITGDFKIFDKKYIWSFAFDVNFGSFFSSITDVFSLNIGSTNLIIRAGGAGFACNHDGIDNSIAFDYSNKKVSIVIVADAYFLYIFFNGQKLAFRNISKKVTLFQFTIFKDSSRTITKIAFFNRSLSKKRVLNWNINGNPFTVDDAMDRVFPQEGYQISDHLVVGNPYFDFVAEQNIVKFKDKFFMYGSVIRTTPSNFIESGIGVFVSNRVDGGYQMYTNDAVIGGERNKAGVTRAMACWAGVKDNTVYVFAAMDYIVPNAGGKIFKSTDGLNFTQVGNFIPTGINQLANIGIHPEKQSNNYYYGVVEGMVSGIWQIYLVRSLNFESGWEIVQLLPSLQIQNTDRMYGGPKLTKTANNEKWIITYHAAHEAGGNVPTSLYVAECSEVEPINWTNKRAFLEIADELPYYDAYNCDQAATAQIIEEGGKTFISYVLAQNLPNVFCQIRILKFDGNKEELFGFVPLPTSV
ncbi:hypothetical protein [Chryseobacterium sp. Hurlbut01]|uniref:hypothetical protein n=1 Tax=Chryseobacterium sp. Hurlbut01 TaxID=1681828 RepID=UPI00067BF9F6|nr:hypothetical protein [Chryseobacterium sp. Hurlbut01]KNB60998.1 hypothetical protein AC804_17805 [Chryseobacterium sp. Hurlbut01]